jgi:hypothetical protein
MLSETRVCKTCLDEKSIDVFGLTGKGRHRRRTCKVCVDKQRDPATLKEKRRRVAARRREERPWMDTVLDSRNSDRKAGRKGHDLDWAFVKEVTSKGCSYCGETSLRMTLDRIDNDRAHSKSNVVPACIRCNYLRGSMPYSAWLHIVPAVRSARDLGLFGSWGIKPFNKKS